MTNYESNPEAIRLKYLYRKLLIRGKITLPIADAIKIIGPDCAYHLYSVKKNPKN